MAKDQEADISLPQKVAEMGSFELDLEDFKSEFCRLVNEKDVPGHEKRE